MSSVRPATFPKIQAAVDAGVDPLGRARELLPLHRRWTQDSKILESVRPVIARSWERAHERRNQLPPLTGQDLRARQQENRELAALMSLVEERLLSVAGQAENQLVVTDGEGYVLSVLGPMAVRRQSDGIGFIAGARWLESDVGTNGIGTAMAERSAVQVFGPEHGREEQHTWVCTSAPIISPVSGKLVATVTLAGSFRTAHPHTLALVAGTAREAESELARRHQLGVNQLRSAVSQPEGDYILVDEHQMVAASRGFGAATKISVVGSLREGQIWVNGLGAMTAEQVHGGWMLRRSAEQTLLELNEHPLPHAVIWVGAERTEISLSSTHWKILQLLADNGPGLDAQGVAQAWSQPVSAVTVRAEVSRLRAKLGGLIAARPYRLVVPVAFSG